MKAVIKSPVASFTGKVGADQFVNGRCEIDPATDTALAYYRRHGYEILFPTAEVTKDMTVKVIGAEGQAESAESPVASGRPATGAKKADWVAFAATLGVDTQGLTVDEIRAAVEKKEAQAQEK